MFFFVINVSVKSIINLIMLNMTGILLVCARYFISTMLDKYIFLCMQFSFAMSAGLFVFSLLRTKGDIIIALIMYQNYLR